jgi:hypothetical protein
MADMETFISLIFILAVLGLGIYSIAFCIYYLGKIAISTFTYYKLGPETFHKQMSENASGHTITATTSVAATPNKKPKSSIIEFVSNIFGLWPTF